METTALETRAGVHRHLSAEDIEQLRRGLVLTRSRVGGVERRHWATKEGRAVTVPEARKAKAPARVEDTETDAAVVDMPRVQILRIQ